MLRLLLLHVLSNVSPNLQENTHTHTRARSEIETRVLGYQAVGEKRSEIPLKNLKIYEISSISPTTHA